MPIIWFNGVTDILGRKQALMRIRFPANPPASGRDESYVLAEGQMVGDIRILAIDTKVGTVKVRILNTITNLSLDANAGNLSARDH